MKIYKAEIVHTFVRECAINALENPASIVSYMEDAWGEYPDQEQFWVIALNIRNKPISCRMVHLGGVNFCNVDLKTVYKYLILEGASAFIVLHNHPSGFTDPSPADTTVTRNFKESSKILGLSFLDHIIVGDRTEDRAGLGYYSFSDAGLI